MLVVGHTEHPGPPARQAAYMQGQQSHAGSTSYAIEQVRSVSYDRCEVDVQAQQVSFWYSARNQQGSILETFETQLHIDLLPRQVTAAEQFVLLCFGVLHGTYVFLPFAASVQDYEVRAVHLDSEQLLFFTQILTGALAEYYYLADLPLAGYIHLSCPGPGTSADQSPSSEQQACGNTDSAEPHDRQNGAANTCIPGAGSIPAACSQVDSAVSSSSSSSRPRVLVPFGGGKDSTLLVELLHHMGCEVQWMYYGEWRGSWDAYTKFHLLAATSPSPAVLKAEQHLPCLARLHDLNLRKDLCFTDYVAYVSFYTFTAAFFALQHGYQNICVGNEHSANEVNVHHPRFGYPVNHQFEKSFEAEQLVHAFLRRYVSPELWYFSGLQHMTELEIALRFVTMCDKYLPFIISCNWATDDNWCGKCDKCAFVYAIFAGFISPHRLLHTVWSYNSSSTAAAAAAAARVDGGTIGAGQVVSNGEATHTGADSTPAAASAAVSKADEAQGVGAATIAQSCCQGAGAAADPPLVPALAGVTDMYASPAHVALFESLMGLQGHKPLECVGTASEVLAAMYLAMQQHYQQLPPSASTAPAAAAAPTAAGSTMVSNTGHQAAGSQQQQHREELQGECEVLAFATDAARPGSGAPAGAPHPPGLPELPLVLSKHRHLIQQEGSQEWVRIQHDIALADQGVWRVPTLYPAWYKLQPCSMAGPQQTHS